MKNAIGRIHSLWKLTVPHYALVVAISFCASTLALTGNWASLALAYYSLPLVLSALGLNALNQVFDYEIDKRSKPKRPLPAGELTEKQALAVAGVAFAAAFAAALALNLIWVTLAFALVSVAYCIPALKIRFLPLASNAVGGTLYGALPFLAAATATNSFTGFFFYLFYATAIVAATSKDFEDAEHDAKFGIKTLPVLVGKKRALAFIPLTLTLILVAALITLFYGGAKAALLYACNASLILTLAFLYAVNKASKHKISAVTQSWFATTNVALVLAIQLVFGAANALNAL